MKEPPRMVGFLEPKHPEEILRHVVGIYVPIQLSKPRRKSSGLMSDVEIASGIVVSISEQWFLITVGHLVDDLQKRHQLGDRVISCRLLTFANSENDVPMIPFGLIDPESPTFLNADLFPLAINEQGFDCLVVPVFERLRDLLELRGIQALHESTWEHPPAQPDIHYLAGFSASLAQLAEEQNANQVNLRLQITAPIVPIYPTCDPPDKLLKPIERLFFHLPVVSGQSGGKTKLFDHPKGMSGGPIIAARTTSETEMQACIIGIQSSWDEDSRVIAATPWPLIVRVIEKMLDGWESSLDSIPTIGS